MTNEELRQIWALQTENDRIRTVSPEAVWRLAKASERFNRTIFWRDTREWIATACAAGTFLAVAFSERPVRWLWVLAAIVACIPMTYVAFRRRERPALPAARTLADHLRESIADVQQQIRLLRSVFWWYLLPLAVSGLLIVLDRLEEIRMHFRAASLRSILIPIGLFALVWWVNHRAVRTRLEPRLRELEKTLHDLESPSSDSQNT